MRKTSKEKQSVSCDANPCCQPAHKTALLKYGFAASISLLTFIIYLPSLQNEFVNWDDNLYIYDNPFIRSLNTAFFKWAFFDFYAANWHPLTWMSHAIDYAVWGLNPVGHHLTNNIIHAVNTFLVVLLVVKLMEIGSNSPTSRGGFQTRPYNIIAAGTTGLLFGLHPLHVESVAWVSERKDLLCALFFLLSIFSYLSYAANKTYRTYFLSLLFFTLALMSKPMAVSLPVVLLILDWYPLERIRSLKSFWSVSIEKLPFILLGLSSAALTVMAQKTAVAIGSLEYAPLSVRIFVAVKSIAAYIWKMVLPLNLLPFYPYPRIVQVLSLEYLLPAILVTGITITGVVIAKKQKLWLSIWGYYVITLLPVIGIVRVGSQEMADRYAYLPSLGFFFIIGLGAGWIWKRTDTLKKGILPVRIIIAVIAVSAFVCFSYLTVEQTGIWKNSNTLWTRVIEKKPAASTAYKNRASYFYNLNQFDRAIEDYNVLLSIDPSNYEAYILRTVSVEALFERGSFYLRQGNKELAVSDLRKACKYGKGGACDVLKALGTASGH
jgi:hypothetical protein